MLVVVAGVRLDSPSERTLAVADYMQGDSFPRRYTDVRRRSMLWPCRQTGLI